jgi:hypothetical protein
MAYQILFIEAQLRTTLNQLQSFLSIAFSHREIERVFNDAKDNQVSEKTYLFYASRETVRQNWSVEGLVKDYEPETLLLTCRGRRSKRVKFDNFFIGHR